MQTKGSKNRKPGSQERPIMKHVLYILSVTRLSIFINQFEILERDNSKTMEDNHEIRTPECLGMFPSLRKPQGLTKYKSIFHTDPGTEYL